MQKDYLYKATVSQIVVASSIGLIIAAAVRYGIKIRKFCKIIPHVWISESSRNEKLEKFSHYVARQMGFDKKDCPRLCKLASEYITRSEGCEDDIYRYFSNEPDADSLFVKLVEEFERCILSYFGFHWNNAEIMITQDDIYRYFSNEPDADSLFVKLVEEFERCILSYFGFHWNNAEIMITQVLTADAEASKRKLKDIVMAATREQRFEIVIKNLKVARVFTTLVEEMKAIRTAVPVDECTDVMAPVAHSDRSPVLLFMGGGMGAGKSTVLKDILQEPFWLDASSNVVIIEADAFKESDVIYRALSSRGHADMLKTAELVHQSSTDAASSLLVTALNEGRDVIMDGTLSWVPFVVQTITMARSVHRHRYRMGIGYKVSDGVVTEKYWERIGEVEAYGGKRKKPYRIELVGVVCDPYLAVIRGIRRAIICRRAVRVNSQLKSHKRFANAFPTYCQLVDNARLYSSNALEGPPKLIGWKDRDNTLLVDPGEIGVLKIASELNENATSINQLYGRQKPSPMLRPGSVWKEIVLSPSRKRIQEELKDAIHKVEKHHQLHGHS